MKKWSVKRYPTLLCLLYPVYPSENLVMNRLPDRQKNMRPDTALLLMALAQPSIFVVKDEITLKAVRSVLFFRIFHTERSTREMRRDG